MNFTDSDFACCNLVGRQIEEWKILEKLPSPSKSNGETGGNFSICYKVEKDGNKCFMKVLDLRKVFDGRDSKVSLTERMQRSSSEFNYEKELSEFCNKKRISKVVKYIQSGEVDLLDGEYKIPTVSYIVYEMAKGNIRKFLDFSRNVDMMTSLSRLADKLRSIRDVATGLKNLHNNEISHQDIKPSNIMAFKEDNNKFDATQKSILNNGSFGTSKIGDLGRSLCFNTEIACPYKFITFHGDYSYAPPEAFFGYFIPEVKERLYQMDNYTLGGLIVFYLTGLSYNSIFNSFLPYDIRILASDYTFPEVETYLINAYDKSIEKIKDDISVDVIKDDIMKIVRYLCHPNPLKRGHPKILASKGTISHTDLQRTITEIDIALTKVRLALSKY